MAPSYVDEKSHQYHSRPLGDFEYSHAVAPGQRPVLDQSRALIRGIHMLRVERLRLMVFQVKEAVVVVSLRSARHATDRSNGRLISTKPTSEGTCSSIQQVGPKSSSSFFPAPCLIDSLIPPGSCHRSLGCVRLRSSHSSAREKGYSFRRELPFHFKPLGGARAVTAGVSRARGRVR